MKGSELQNSEAISFDVTLHFKSLYWPMRSKKGKTGSDVISLSNAVTRREKKAAVAGTLKCQSLCSND